VTALFLASNQVYLTDNIFHTGRYKPEVAAMPMHKIALSPDIVARVTRRRGGKLHAYDSLNPASTALVVIDMQNVWVKEGMPAYSPYCEAIVPNINRLAAATRQAGGKVYWVRAIYGDDAPRTWSAYMDFLDRGQMQDMLDALTDGNEGAELWPDLDIQPEDEITIKRRFSALIQGSSDLGERLGTAGMDTLIITGTATNVCCESTARDAFMLNYRTLMVSDANATSSDEAHNASLNALFNRFADVFTTDEVVAMLDVSSSVAAAE
jgi:ureidoacrylate peracid hydrolase